MSSRRYPHRNTYSNKKRRRYGPPVEYIPKRRCQSPRRLSEDDPGYSRRKALREQFYPVKKSKLRTNASSDLLLDILKFLSRNESLKCQLVSKNFHMSIDAIKPFLSLHTLDELAIHHNGEVYAVSRDKSIHLESKRAIEELKCCLINMLQIDALSKRVFETLKMIKNVTYMKLKVNEFSLFEPVYRLRRLQQLFEDCISVRRFSLGITDSDLEEVIRSNLLNFSTPAEEFNLNYASRQSRVLDSNMILGFLASKIQIATRKYAKFRGLQGDELNFCQRFVEMFEAAENPRNLFQSIEISATKDQIIAAHWYLDAKFNALFSNNIPGVPSGYVAYQVMRNDFWTLKVMFHNKMMDKFIFSILG